MNATDPPGEPEDLWATLTAWCARAERSPRQLRQKLTKLGVHSAERGQELEEALLAADFLNPDRFVHAFVQDKFHLQGWGRRKIRHALVQEGVPPGRIGPALEAVIEPAAQSDLIDRQLARQLNKLKLPAGSLSQKDLGRVSRHLQQKGHPWEAIRAALERAGCLGGSGDDQ